MESQQFLLILVCVVTAASAGRQLPAYVKACIGDGGAERDECIRNTFNELIPRVGKKLPELGLPVLDPITIEKVTLKTAEQQSSVGFEATLTDMKVHGLSKAQVTKARGDRKNSLLQIDMKIPKVHIDAKYHAVGKVLLFQFDSTGKYFGNFTNLEVFSTWKCTLFQKNGETFCETEKPVLDMKLEGIEIFFENLLPSPELNDRVNTAINENSDLLYSDIKPVILEAIKEIVKNSVSIVHKRFTFDTLYPLN